jgi:hypothetical protein
LPPSLNDWASKANSYQIRNCTTTYKEEEAVILQLQSAKKELEARGQVSQELKAAYMCDDAGI